MATNMQSMSILRKAMVQRQQLGKYDDDACLEAPTHGRAPDVAPNVCLIRASDLKPLRCEPDEV